MESDETKPSGKICFAVLVHKRREVVQDMLDNIRQHCPNSAIVLFNGGEEPELCKNLGYPVCPASRKLNYGVTAIYMIEVMEWLEQLDFDYDYLINLDSDALFLRGGYEGFIETEMKGVDYMGVDVYLRPRNWYCGVQLRKEWQLWKPLLLTDEFTGVFNVGQVFSRRLVRLLLASPQYELLKSNLLQTQAFGVDEIAFVMMAEQLGFTPKSYPHETGRSIRYRPHYLHKKIVKLMNDNPSCYLVHPVHRKLEDQARALIRDLTYNAWRHSDARSRYGGSVRPEANIDGSPGLMRNGDTMELVAPLADGGFGYWRNRVRNQGFRWSGPRKFGSGRWNAVSVVRAANGNLQCVARKGDRLFFVWRDEKPTRKWHRSRAFASGVHGMPLMMENRSGGLDVIAPLVNGGIGYWWRDNNPKQLWHGPAKFGDGKVNAVSLSNKETGQLVAVAEKHGRLMSYVRSDKGTWRVVQE